MSRLAEPGRSLLYRTILISYLWELAGTARVRELVREGFHREERTGDPVERVFLPAVVGLVQHDAADRVGVDVMLTSRRRDGRYADVDAGVEVNWGN